MPIHIVGEEDTTQITHDSSLPSFDAEYIVGFGHLSMPFPFMFPILFITKWHSLFESSFIRTTVCKVALTLPLQVSFGLTSSCEMYISVTFRI